MTRFELLQYVRESIINNGLEYGLCYEIRETLEYNGLSIFDCKNIPKFFPAFTRENALQFGASLINDFWWLRGQTEGRLDFLDWLIDYYKDDQTDLKTLEL